MYNQTTLKIKIISSLFLVLILLASTAFGQSYVFKVLASKGSNQVKSSQYATWKPIKTGTSLNSGDQLKVSQGAYLGLVHSSGITLELKNPTVVDINELAAGLQLKGTNVLSKYADFVITQMAKTAQGDRLQATGAVNRASAYTSIQVHMPWTSEVLNPDVFIQWKPVKGNPVYVVTVMNQFDEIVTRKETSDTGVKLNLNEKDLASQRLLIVNVGVKGNEEMKSENYGIKRVTGEELKNLEAKLNSLTGKLSTESSLDQIMLASFYEQNNLLVDATSSYQKAIELSPEVYDFKTMFTNFRERNNL